MKNINDTQIKVVMDLLAKYNIGVQEYVAVEKLFKELPVNETLDEKTPN